MAVLGACGAAASAVAAGAEGDGALRFDARLAASGFTTQDHPPAGRSPGDTLQFRDRLSRAHGLMRDGDQPTTIPVVGGTGAYVGARGTLLVADAAAAVARYEVRLD